MKDIELLELAARAAGIDIRLYFGNSINPLMLGTNHGMWNPLTSDGDALRLAVKLGMFLDTEYQTATAKKNPKEQDWHGGDSSGDDMATMREAITRAAASIGETMK